MNSLEKCFCIEVNPTKFFIAFIPFDTQEIKTKLEKQDYLFHPKDEPAGVNRGTLVYTGCKSCVIVSPTIYEYGV